MLRIGILPSISTVVSIAIAASVLVLAFDCCYICAAFQLGQHSAAIRHHNNNRRSISRRVFGIDMNAAENGGHVSGSSVVAPTTATTATAAAGEPTTALESLQHFVDVLTEESDDATFQCRLVSSAIEDPSSGARLLRNATVTEINTIIFRPVADRKPTTSDAAIPVAADIGESCDADGIGTMYAVAIVPTSCKVDVRNFTKELVQLQQRNVRDDGDGDDHHSKDCYDQWELAPSHLVKDLCGFAPGTVPPLLVPPKRDGDEGAQRRKPVATIVDSSLLWNTTATTRSNGSTKRLLLGGGGSLDHRCLIDLEFLIGTVLEIKGDADQSSTVNAKIANMLRFDGGMNHEPHTDHPCDTSSIDDEVEEEKPFFQIAPPAAGASNAPAAGVVAAGRPHRPVPVTAVGRLISVRQIAKRLVFADLAPPGYDYRRWRAVKHATANAASAPSTASTSSAQRSTATKKYDKADDGMSSPPWRSGEDGRDMHVQIIVGKSFCERYEDGIERLRGLKPGRLVLVRGAANVDPMQKNGWRNSSGNWAQKRSLDVIVSSFELLDEDERDDSLSRLVEDAQREVASRGSSNLDWNSLLPWERKLDFQRRAIGGSFNGVATTPEKEAGSDPSRRPFSTFKNKNDNDSAANILTLDRFNSHLRDDPLDVNIVNDDESIRAMASDVSGLFSRIEKEHQTSSSSNNGNNSKNLLDYVAGIDCEWRPTGAYAETLLEGPDENPVALLQICLPAIGSVYLVDAHSTLRANLAQPRAMTESERILSDTIGAIFSSEIMIKVGYSVTNDFRKFAASFPHIPFFQSVRAVVELSTLAEKLHPKSSKTWLGSLQKLTKLVLGYNITKEQQCSNWEARPLTPSQIEYATLDCALPPRLLDEMAEGCGNARMREVLPGVTKAWRFHTVDGAQKDAIRRLKATRVVGNTFVASQSWLERTPPPEPTSIPEEGGGPYTDVDGLLKMPADLVNIGDKDALWRTMVGKTVGGGKKRDCVTMLLVGDGFPKGAVLDCNPRSGFIAFRDGLALFVNMPDPSNPPRRKMPYPNKWLEDGQILTWYIRKNDWENGNSETAKLLLSGSNTNDGDDDGDDDNSAPSPSSVVLFVRVGTNSFVCCGSCNATVAEDGHPGTNKKLVKLNLHLNDWAGMNDPTTAFSKLLLVQKQENSPPPPRKRLTRQALQNTVAQALIDGNIIGALSLALDEAHVGPNDRSIACGRTCVKTLLSNSDDPAALRAMKIIESTVV